MNLNNTFLTKIVTSVFAIILMVSFLLPTASVRAEEDNATTPRNEQAEVRSPEKKEESKIDRFIQSQTAGIDAIISAEATSTPNTATTSTPVTTTPTVDDRSNVHKPDNNKDLEDILNETLEPEKPIEENTTDSENASTTPVIGSTDLAAPSTDATAINAQNSFIPTNYYTPLDNLSPEATYALSFIALLSGLIGAYLIIREPRTSGDWAPAPVLTRESLLES